VISKGFISAVRNGFAPVKILYAIPKSPIYHGNNDAYPGKRQEKPLDPYVSVFALEFSEKPEVIRSP